jgi:hypothetical protein
VTLEEGTASGCVDVLGLGVGEVALGAGGVELGASLVTALGALCTFIIRDVELASIFRASSDDGALGVVVAMPPAGGASSGNGTASGLVTADTGAVGVSGVGGHVAFVTFVSTACSSVSAFMKTASPTNVSQTIVSPIAGATNKTRLDQCIDMHPSDASTDPTPARARASARSARGSS